MKKKFLVAFLSLILGLLLVVPSTFAAKMTDSSGFNLETGMSSATTSRIFVPFGQLLTIGVHMYYTSPKKPLTYKIFKSGEEYKPGTGSINGTTDRSADRKIYVPIGEYSMRVYSASEDQSAYGALQTFTN